MKFPLKDIFKILLILEVDLIHLFGILCTVKIRNWNVTNENCIIILRLMLYMDLIVNFISDFFVKCKENYRRDNYY
jgi:hypothetical protein